MLLAVTLGIACAPGRSQLLIGADARAVDAMLQRHPLAHGANIRADGVARTPAATVHLVQIRGSEAPHRHERHDLVVTVLRGDGVMVVGDAARDMRAGDVAVVPRGEPHWFDNRGGSPTVALVVFAPPLDAPDVTPLVVDTSPDDR
jgi:mannose-6-phosphate isomerase-like protein (cupin superfamily)